MKSEDESLNEQTYKKLQERKKRIQRGEPPEKEIEVDCFHEDSYSIPRFLTRQEVDELTGQ